MCHPCHSIILQTCYFKRFIKPFNLFSGYSNISERKKSCNFCFICHKISKLFNYPSTMQMTFLNFTAACRIFSNIKQLSFISYLHTNAITTEGHINMEHLSNKNYNIISTDLFRLLITGLKVQRQRMCVHRDAM
jgi:hypothetical protein